MDFLTLSSNSSSPVGGVHVSVRVPRFPMWTFDYFSADQGPINKPRPIEIIVSIKAQGISPGPLKTLCLSLSLSHMSSSQVTKCESDVDLVSLFTSSLPNLPLDVLQVFSSFSTLLSILTTEGHHNHDISLFLSWLNSIRKLKQPCWRGWVLYAVEEEQRH